MSNFYRYLSDEQRLHVAVCDYLDLQHRGVFYFHPHNEGKRSPYERYLAKVMRLRAGLPDLMLPLSRGGHFGLGIELKVKSGKLTESQKQVGQNLHALGWKVEVCRGFEQAREVIEGYLNPQKKMPALKKNKYAEKWTKELALEFISHVRRAMEKESIYHIGVLSVRSLEKIREKYPMIKATKEQIWSYIKEIFSDEVEVLDAIKKAEDTLEGKIVEDTLRREIKSAPMAIFYLKNKFGWKDKSEQEINLKGSISIEKWLETARDDPS